MASCQKKRKLLYVYKANIILLKIKLSLLVFFYKDYILHCFKVSFLVGIYGFIWNLLVLG